MIIDLLELTKHDAQVEGILVTGQKPLRGFIFPD